MPLARKLLIFAAFLVLSLLFFRICIDNGFWLGYDFVGLENSVLAARGPSAIFASESPFKFQPLVYAVHYFLFLRFGFDAGGYLLFNILLHGFNSFLVYLLVAALLRDRVVALVAGLLFVFTVGSYGKSVMTASGIEDLLITTLTLCTMLFYFSGELYHRGRMSSPFYLSALVFFVASMLTRSTSLAILVCFVAFNFFFKKERGRRIFDPGLLLFIFLAAAALAVKATVFEYRPPLYTEYPGAAKFIYYAAKNVFNYLVRMIFPIHTSHLVSEANTAVRFVYRFATEIRILIALTVISYSFFGFVFGNRAIRFFIAWTYIMVLPFAFFQFPEDWLNMRHLYLVSVGFVSVIAAGAVYCSRMIAENRLRRFVPFVVPLAFVLLSRFIIVQLDRSYEAKASGPEISWYRQRLAEKYPEVSLEGDRLIYRK
ncbi:MAG: hypothetical protein PHQ19_05345 [Candidatus Krumholzibacteria bacterium]|nr:hypothetical protein [Candidatus Krumholzibacteria bacterium]